MHVSSELSWAGLPAEAEASRRRSVVGGGEED